jgi:hypothetical protein
MTVYLAPRPVVDSLRQPRRSTLIDTDFPAPTLAAEKTSVAADTIPSRLVDHETIHSHPRRVVARFDHTELQKHQPSFVPPAHSSRVAGQAVRSRHR